MTSLRRTIVAVVCVVSLSAATSVHGETVRRALNPAHLSNSTQYGYSQANVVTGNSRTIYVAGQVGTAENGKNDFKSQVDRSFDRLLAVLKAAGASANDVVKITLLIKDYGPDKLRYLVQKRRTIFGKNPPASTLIPVTRLYADGVSFEIDAIAAVKQGD